MSHCRILIVEDELLIATDIQQTLLKAGHQPIGIAGSYDSAVSQAESARPDLVLMDIALRGERSGIAAANTVRERWGIPVIFLTANADEATLAQARAAGAYSFLTKPFRNEELLEAVRIAIAQHQHAEQLFASTRWLTTVLDSMTDSIIATDSEGLVRYLNPAAEQLTEWTHHEAEGKPIEAVYPLTDLAGQAFGFCLLRQALVTGKAFGRMRLRLTTRSGNRVEIEDSAAPILQDGKIVGAVTVFRDITLRLEQERRQEIERDRLEEQAQAATEALGQTRKELRSLATGLMASQEQERRRIARELHDDIGQQIAVLGMLIDRSGSADPDVQNRLQQITTDLRRTSHRLHPTIIADLGITAALEMLVEQEQDLDRDVHLSAALGTDVKMPLEIATTLYRVAQEGLRNAAKHAGNAGVQLSLWREGNQVLLQVQDDGPGFSLGEVRSRGGLGLISMQERAASVGGRLSISSNAGEGTVLLLQVPIPSTAALQ